MSLELHLEEKLKYAQFKNKNPFCIGDIHVQDLMYCHSIFGISKPQTTIYIHEIILNCETVFFFLFLLLFLFFFFFLLSPPPFSTLVIFIKLYKENLFPLELKKKKCCGSDTLGFPEKITFKFISWKQLLFLKFEGIAAPIMETWIKLHKKYGTMLMHASNQAYNLAKGTTLLFPRKMWITNTILRIKALGC